MRIQNDKKTIICLKRGKMQAPSRDWFQFCIWLVERERERERERGVSFLDQSQSKIKQNQCNPGVLSALNWKLLHQNVNGSLSNLKIYYLIFICFPGSGRGKISKYWENQNDQEHLYGGCRTQTRMWGKKIMNKDQHTTTQLLNL